MFRSHTTLCGGRASARLWVRRIHQLLRHLAHCRAFFMPSTRHTPCAPLSDVLGTRFAAILRSGQVTS